MYRRTDDTKHEDGWQTSFAFFARLLHFNLTRAGDGLSSGV
jgi:hypothetical protein